MPDPPDPDMTGAYQPPGSVHQHGERFAPGELLASRYRVVAPLGKGGMGEVYRADDLTLGQPVALKFLPADIAADPDRLRRFQLEAQTASALNHPNVLVVHDIGGDPVPYLVSELLDGQSLRERLRDGNPIDSDQLAGQVLAEFGTIIDLSDHAAALRARIKLLIEDLAKRHGTAPA